ncbi:MAG: TIGR03016 family PEP-CTERM system-associated outer membrane protein [Betaproteobacteria bacterium]
MSLVRSGRSQVPVSRVCGVRRATGARAGIALLVTAISSGAGASEWNPRMSLSLTATGSDNPSLRVRGQEQSDLILRTAPVFGVKRSSGMLKVDMTYAPVVVGSLNDTTGDSLFNTLNASANLEAVPSRFFVDSRATIAQTFISPFGAQPRDVTTSTTNRTETRTIALSPYYQGRFSGGGTFQLRDDFLYTTYAQGNLPDQTTNRVSAVASGDPGRFIVPGVDATHQDSSLASGQQFSSDILRGRASFRFDADLSVYLTGGHERNDYGTRSFSGSTYGVGGQWQPTPRTTVNLSVDKRFFGTGYAADVSHRTRATTWRLRLSRQEQVSQQTGIGVTQTSTASFLSELLRTSIPDEAARQTEVNRLIQTGNLPPTLGATSSYVSPRVVLVESLEPSFGIIGVRNSILLTVYWRATTPLSTAPTSGTPDIFSSVSKLRQQGFALTASHSLTEQTSLSAGIDRVQTQSTALAAGAAALETLQTTLRFTVLHSLNPRTSLSAGVRFLTLDSSSTNDSRERALLFTLAHQFR